MSEEITNFQEFEDYCNKYAEYIYVRTKIDGKWQAVALSDLDKKEQLLWINAWYSEGRLPYRLKTDEELEEEGIE